MKKLERIKKFDIQVLEGAEYLNDTSLAEIKGGIVGGCNCDAGAKKETICGCNGSGATYTYVPPCTCKGEGTTYTVTCLCNGGTLEAPPLTHLSLIQFE